MKQTNIDRHYQCQCEIRYRSFRGKDKLTPGLFCSHHDVFLDWLKDDIANELIQIGIKVTPYLERKKPKKNAKKSKYYQIAKQNQIRAKKSLTKTKTDAIITL
jgi:hypothetical protein